MKISSLLSAEQNRPLLQAFMFFLRLLVLSVPLYAIITFGDLSVLQYFVATNSYWLVKSMGYDVLQDGATLTVGASDQTRQPFDFLISEDSTGWKSMLFFSGLLFAVPGVALNKRIRGLAIGLPAIFSGNLLRITAIVLAERTYGINYALIVHDYLWRIGLIAIVLVLWASWLRSVRTTPRSEYEH